MAVRARVGSGRLSYVAEQASEGQAGGLRPLLTTWLAWLVVMTGANLAAPLYAVWARQFHFSSLVLTLIFTTYAATLVPSLLLFGRLSDRFGRRPVLLLGLAAACVGLVLFAFADATAWLFAARAMQGVAVGMISGPATAALVEFEPTRDARRPALLAGLAQAAGSGLGPLVAGPLAQWVPEPRRLCFLVLLTLTIAGGCFVATVREEAGDEREPWRIERPRVPAEIRGAFARVSLTAATVWAALGLYLSIVPSYASSLLRTHDLALIALVSAIALAASCATQIVSQRRGTTNPRRNQMLGLVFLALGLGGLTAAGPFHSLALLLVAATATGSGHGYAFLDAQQELNAIAPQERRGEVTAAFIACIYLFVGSSVIATGVLDLRVSLELAVGAVAVVLAATALVAAAWQAHDKARPGHASRYGSATRPA
jgi:MFS family permease